MAKQKIQYTHESVKLDAEIVQQVRDEVKKTKQSICGFIELAVTASLEKDNVILQRYGKEKETK